MSKPEDGPKRPETKVVTAGRSPFDHHGLVNPPVYHASTILHRTVEALASVAVRTRVDGQIVQLTDRLSLDRQMRHHIEVVDLLEHPQLGDEALLGGQQGGSWRVL